MDVLFDALEEADLEAYEKIVENKFTDTSLKLLNEESLTKMGITAEATKLIIFGVVDQLKNQQRQSATDSSPQPSTSKRRSTTDSSPSLPKKQVCLPEQFRVDDIDVYQLLNANKKFRQILYDQLDHKIIPDNNALKRLVRIVCAPFNAYLQSFKPAKLVFSYQFLS